MLSLFFANSVAALATIKSALAFICISCSSRTFAIESLLANAKLFVVGLDRQEKGAGTISATAALERDFNIVVQSIVKLAAHIHFSKNSEHFHAYQIQLQEYRETWGA